MVPLNWQLRLPSDQLGFLMPLNQKEKKGVTCEIIETMYLGLCPQFPGTELLKYLKFP